MSYPVNNFELDFEYVLYNHLIQLSNFLAQGRCDLESMISVYEQYAINQLSKRERETLRKFKELMNKIRNSLLDKYDELESRVTDIERLAAIRDLRDRDEDELDRIYLRYLLRWLVACTRKKFQAGGNDPYAEWEFFRDLKLDLSQLDVDVSKIFEEVGINAGRDDREEAFEL